MKSFESPDSSQEPSEQTPTEAHETESNTTAIETPAELEDYASTLRASLEEEIEKLAESSTETFSEKLKETVDRFREKVKEELQVAFLAAALFAPAQAHGADIEYMQETIDDPESYEYKVGERMAELREKLIDDTKETYYILLGRRDSLEEVTKVEGNENSPVISSTEDELLNAATKAMRILAEESTSFKKVVGHFTNNPITHVTIHNHPYATSQEVFNIPQEAIDSMKSGEMPPAVFPISGIDLKSSMMNSSEGVDSIGYIEEPSGTWKYDVNESESNILKMRGIKKQTEYDAQAIFQTYVYSKPGLLEEMEKGMAGLQNDRYYDYYEKHHPELAKSLMDMYERFQQRLEDELDKDFVSAGKQIDTLFDTIREASLAGQDTTDLIREYVNTATDLGFHIEYQSKDGTLITPNEKPEPYKYNMDEK